MRTLGVTTVGILLLSAVAGADDLRVIVGFKGTPDASLLTKHGATEQRALPKLHASVAMLPARAISDLRAEADVAYVEEDGVAEALAKPSGGSAAQPAQETPWGVTKVAAPLSGNVGAGINVAIIDTGIDLDHPDLEGNIKGKVDFTGSRKGADDENGHGSHVAGTVAAIQNSIGVVGIAPGASLYAVRVLDSRGSGWWTDVAEGISWCGDNGMNIANMSLGGSASSIVETACVGAANKGVLLIAAAGNSGDGNTSTTETSYPAAYASVVAVGATDSSDGLASFSNSGSYVDVSGPGVSVLSTYKNKGYGTLSGTSMSSPHAAGMAALLWYELGSTAADAASVRAELHVRVRSFSPAAGYGSGIVYFPK